MLYADDFRRIARQALTNKWGVAVGTGFVAALLGGTGGASSGFSSSAWRDNMNDADFFHSEAGRTLLLVFLGIASVAAIYALILFFIGGAVRLGYIRFNKNLIDGNNPQFSDLFSRFNVFWPGFLLQLLIIIYTFLWTLLFIIPGIIAAYSYSMAPYILEENPGMPVNEAIRLSKEMMRGNKWRLFCVQISFIGWSLLSILTCGIGFLFLQPYMSAAECAFFYDVSGRYRNQGAAGYNQVPPAYQQYQGNSQQYQSNNQNYQQYSNNNQNYQQYPNNNQGYQKDQNNNQPYQQDGGNQQNP